MGFQAESLCFGQNYSIFGVSVSFFLVRNGIKWPKKSLPKHRKLNNFGRNIMIRPGNPPFSETNFGVSVKSLFRSYTELHSVFTLLAKQKNPILGIGRQADKTMGMTLA